MVGREEGGLECIEEMEGSREARYKKWVEKRACQKYLGIMLQHTKIQWNPVIVFPFTIQRDLKKFLNINLPKNDQIELIIFIGNSIKP